MNSWLPFRMTFLLTVVLLWNLCIMVLASRSRYPSSLTCLFSWKFPDWEWSYFIFIVYLCVYCYPESITLPKISNPIKWNGLKALVPQNKPAYALETDQRNRIKWVYSAWRQKEKNILIVFLFCHYPSGNYVAVLTEEMPKRFLWNQLTVFSEANPLQIKLESKVTGKITDMKPRYNIFFWKHPWREEREPPTPPESIGIPGFRPFIEAVEGTAALRGARGACWRQPPKHQAAEQTHGDPHGYLCMGRTPGQQATCRVSPIVLAIDWSHLVNSLSFSATLWSSRPRWVHQIKTDRQGLRMGTWVIFM